MNISDAYPSKYLKAADLKGKEYTVTIADVRMEEVGEGDHKPVLFFQGSSRGMVLNKTNAQELAHHFGDETDNWRGRQVVMGTRRVQYQGKMVDGLSIRVDSAAPPDQAPPPEPPPGPPSLEDPDTDLPF